MSISQKRILLVLFVTVLLVFSRSNILFAQKNNGENGVGNTDVVKDQGSVNKKIEVKKIVKKTKKHRKAKSQLTPEQKKQKLIVRELKRFENAKKSILNRERKAKKILKKVKKDRAKELIKHDKRIQEIENMEFK